MDEDERFKGMTHIPVLYNEVLCGLKIQPDGVYLDMTLGGFGHGAGICRNLNKNGIYIGLDRDPEAIQRAKNASEEYEAHIILEHCNFNDFEEILDQHGIVQIDGCLMDLGVSSFQLDDNTRGFSFMKEGPLDMRMDTTQKKSAYDVVNTYSESELKRVLYQYGEEKFTPSIVKSILKTREYSPIETTTQLVDAVKKGIPKKEWFKGKNPATKTFQAIRIEVNSELSELYDTIIRAIERLREGGRICIISFHSLEDRIVKTAMKEKKQGCTCPKDFPVCVCGKVPEIKIITKNPILPSESELKKNSRSRSAKLRIAEKIISEDEKNNQGKQNEEYEKHRSRKKE